MSAKAPGAGEGAEEGAGEGAGGGAGGGAGQNGQPTMEQTVKSRLFESQGALSSSLFYAKLGFGAGL